MKLNKVRKQIDKVDHKIAKLLNKRFTLVKHVKAIKKEDNISVENKDREQTIITKNIVLINDKYKDQYQEIYKTIFKVSKTFQEQ